MWPLCWLPHWFINLKTDLSSSSRMSRRENWNSSRALRDMNSVVLLLLLSLTSHQSQLAVVNVRCLWRAKREERGERIIHTWGYFRNFFPCALTDGRGPQQQAGQQWQQIKRMRRSKSRSSFLLGAMSDGEIGGLRRRRRRAIFAPISSLKGRSKQMRTLTDRHL